ncbi:hypothetical protein B0H14DRAFT_3705389 [Mycena olivaceomarginata]|nr:hypothetical protein B0H14DRAFT_3705389 [Mycena olivaceomarginata]
MKRRLTDFENQAVSSQRPRKQRKRHNRAADADKSIENPNPLEDRTREKGRLFAIQEALFLVDDTVFEVEEDEDFVPAWDGDAEWNGNKNVSHLFRNNLLLKRRGWPPKTIERMHRIRCALPGAITDSAILAIWLHSADTTLTEIGDQTSINYRARHSYYLQHIVEALASNKAWAVDLLAYWDRTLFPDTDSPNGADGSAGREIEEDDEDFFASAQALTRPRSPRIHSSTSPPPRRLTPSQPSPQRAPAASSSRQEQENCESTSHGGHSRSPRRLQRHGEGQRRR